MKKNLVVRAGAIAIALFVAFFAILPDLVSAEGDSAETADEVAMEEAAPEIPAEGTVEESPGIGTGTEEIPDENVPAGDETTNPPQENLPQEGGSDVEEPPSTEEPSTEQEPSEEPSDPKDEEIENPSESEEPSEEPGTEEPVIPEPDNSGETAPPQQPVQPDTTVQQGEAAGEDASGEMDSIEDYVAFLEEVGSANEKAESIRVRLADGENLLDQFDLTESDEDDFIIEGSTIVGYQGDGGYITIPGTVTEIGDNAFFGVSSITGVVIPASVWRIGDSAFNSCVSLRAIAIPDTVVSVGASAFANCTALAEAAVGAGTGVVSPNEFYNCTSLQSVSVAEGISSIESGAFAGCGNLGSISLPSSLSGLDLGAFAGDVNLASISVASGSYSSYDGCVYTAGGSRLLLCPQGKTSIAFAPGMQSIASGAFSGCNYLLSAVIPDAAGSIESNAFSGSSIKAVTIPTAVTSIGSQAGWAPNVVYGYRGSAAESWARASNYVFESLDGGSNVGGIVNEEHIEDPDDSDPEDGGNSSNSNTNTPGIHLGPAGTGSGTQATISRTSGGKTPKTGVEDYGSYFLFSSIFLAGIGFFAYSKKLRFSKHS